METFDSKPREEVTAEETGNHDVNVVEQTDVVPQEAVSRELFGVSVSEIRAGLIKALLACLVAAAAVAVFAILVGSMTDIVWRAIGTIVVAMLHIFLVFSVLSVTVDQKNQALARSSNFLINATAGIVILSFFTAVLQIWDALPGDISMKLYATYLVLFACLLHVKALLDVEAMDKKLHPYVFGNTFFISIVAAMILGVVYVGADGFQLLNGFYGRLLAASAIIDVTLSMIIAVLQRLNIQKHPEQYPNVRVAQSLVARIFVLLILFVVIGWPILTFILSLTYGSY